MRPEVYVSGPCRAKRYEFACCVSGNYRVMNTQNRMTSPIDQLSTLLVRCFANEDHLFFSNFNVQNVTTKISVT